MLGTAAIEVEDAKIDVRPTDVRRTLLVHGDRDPVLSHRSSEEVYRRAGEPRRLVVYEGAGHTLDEAAGSLYVEVKAWFLKHLPGTLV
ncbi:MAG: lysophospholipase [Methanoculleus marisnigri]|nr:lysophospholipase [Methanoculleus marisnigri]